jgi:hypothetical protein
MLNTAQTSTKHRNTLIAAVIIVVLVVSLVTSLIIFCYQPTSNQLPTKLRVNVSLNQTEVIQGNTLQAQVNITTIGKAENVTLSSNSGSSDINCTFQPSNGISNFTSILTMNVPDSTPTGNYTITITALETEQSQKASFVVFVYPQSSGITVSGKVNSIPLSEPFPSSLISIQFTDIQTSANNSFSFPYNYPPQSGVIGGNSAIGDYSVILINGHTYNITVTYYLGPTAGNISIKTDYLYDFTVNAIDGQTVITKTFP